VDQDGVSREHLSIQVNSLVHTSNTHVNQEIIIKDTSRNGVGAEAARAYLARQDFLATSQTVVNTECVKGRAVHLSNQDLHHLILAGVGSDGVALS